mmetsp:Transcript_5921/g.11089  ORF Transcript_5921/g.11089 Transcript_5921/m.11089 type:complete len:106 (+) Transcript_5921:75-392(+)
MSRLRRDLQARSHVKRCLLEPVLGTHVSNRLVLQWFRGSAMLTKRGSSLLRFSAYIKKQLRASSSEMYSVRVPGLPSRLCSNGVAHSDCFQLLRLSWRLPACSVC